MPTTAQITVAAVGCMLVALLLNLAAEPLPKETLGVFTSALGAETTSGFYVSNRCAAGGSTKQKCCLQAITDHTISRYFWSSCWTCGIHGTEQTLCST